MRLLTVIALVFFLGACATPHAPLTPVSFSGPMHVTSDKTAKIRLASGAIRGSRDIGLIFVGTTPVPIPRGPYPHLQFNEEVQRIFVESFRGELQRLQIFRAAFDDSSEELSELDVQFTFAQTFHNPNRQEYTLDVVMEITGGKTPFTRKYHVISSEGDSWWEKIKQGHIPFFRNQPVTPGDGLISQDEQKRDVSLF